MERMQGSGVEPLSNKDQVTHSRDRLRDFNFEQPHDLTVGVTYERLHPASSDLVLPITFLAITLLGIFFVLIILIIWLRTHLSCSSSKKGYEDSVPSRTKESHLMHTMEPTDNDVQFKVVIDNSDEDNKNTTDGEVDDFKFKLPSILNDMADFKYIDESDGTRNISPPILKMSNNGGSSPKLPESDTTDDSRKNDSSGNSTPNNLLKSKANETKFIFPDESSSSKSSKSNIDNRFGKFKIAMSEQWIMPRNPPLDWRGYNINMPKAFSFVDGDFGRDATSGEGPSKKYSATRSPSLEKDEKSPFYSAKMGSPVDFVFEKENAEKHLGDPVFKSGNISPVIEVMIQPVATDTHSVNLESNLGNISPANTKVLRSSELFNQTCEVTSVHEKASTVRRFGALNAGLRICTMNENVNPGFHTEKIEIQNSPRLVDTSSGKENNPSPRFNFSPKFFATADCKSPKFFGTSDQRSPVYFAENQSKNTSPKILGAEKPLSPRFIYSDTYKSTQSPLILDNGNGGCFKFENGNGDNNNRLENISNTKLAIQSLNSITCSKKTDTKNVSSEYDLKDISSLSNNSLSDNLDANVNIISCQTNDKHIIEFTDDKTDQELANKFDENIVQVYSTNLTSTDTTDEVDSSARNRISLVEESHDSLTVSHSESTANYRRQRLKSISLDSDNAKFIEQNLGLPMVKHLKQKNLYDPCDDEKSSISPDEVNMYTNQISPSTKEVKRTYFDFNIEEGEKYNSGSVTEGFNESIITISQSEDFASLDENINSSRIYHIESAPSIAFSEMEPRFSPKEFENIIDDERISKGNNKNKRNLTIDLNKRDVELEKELSQYECLDSAVEKRMTPKTPTLKIKATSLDSSETLSLSLPQTNTLQVPQNSISVPNTPKRQLKRALTQKSGKLVKSNHYNNNYGNLNDIVPRIYSENQQGRKLYMNVKCHSNFIDSGIFLRENHANLMLFQATKYPSSRGINSNSGNFSRRMGSFDENMMDYVEGSRQIQPQSDNRLSLLQKPCDVNLLGSNLLNFKQNLSVSSTNLKTLPEGVPSNDFEIQPEDKASKKTLLQRRGSNQSLTINLEGTGTSLKYSTLSLQGSNLSLASFGASSHNLANIKNSASNFSLNTDNRQKKNILERRNSNTSLTLNLDYTSQHGRLYSGSHYNLTNQEGHAPGQSKKCLLQRRGSNTSLTLNLQNSSSNLNRCTSNSSLNIHNEVKIGQKKGLLERRSSNTSLTLNINSSNPQFDNNRVLSVSNYNLDGVGSGLSRYNSNQSINNTGEQSKKGLLERRSSNTSLSLNINNSNFNLQGSDLPRDIEIDDSVLQTNLNTYKDDGSQQKEKHRKSLSTENLFSKSYKSRMFQCQNTDNVYSFGSHDNLCSNFCMMDSMENIESGGKQNLTYICGDQENEIIYAFGNRQHIENAGFQTTEPIRNITTKPLSPHSTSEDFKLYLANIQHLQNATNILTREQLKDLNSVFQDGYSKTECPQNTIQSCKPVIDVISAEFSHLDIGKNNEDPGEGEYNPQRLLPEPVLPSAEYQKSLLRNLHQEFWDLPTNFQEKPMVFGSNPKNRYKTILPNEHSRVILRAEPGETEEGYINANYIKGHEYTKNCYIATQGPLQNTIYDFWLMVYQNGCQFHRDGCTKTNEDRHFGSPQARTKTQADYKSKRFADNQNISVQKIVMLTNLLENGRQKCEKYFPSEVNEEMVFKSIPYSSYSSCGGEPFFGEEVHYDVDSENLDDVNMFRVKNVGTMHKTGYTIRKLFVEYTNKYLKGKMESEKINSGDDTASNFKVSVIGPDSKEVEDSKIDYLVVYHYWFDNWADHKCPKDVTALLDLSLDVLQNRLIDFDTEPSENKDSAEPDPEIISKERRLSAFQSARAFFDEFSRSNAADDHTKPGNGRKNSLASKLDLPKMKYDVLRRESTGAIDLSKVIASKPFVHDVNRRNKKEDRGETVKSNVEMPPIIVHCSAGIGRTGCLIAVLNGIRQLKADEKVDILGIVCNMRLNRGGMVQNSEQYELIHKVLCLYEDNGLQDF